MADMANAPPPVPPVEPDEQAKQLLADARAAKTVMSDALARYEDRIWQAAWDRGHQQGWQEGYQYALWMLEQARNRAAHEPPPRAEPPAAPPIIEEDGEESPSTQEAVLRMVTAMPGLRGVEIVEKLHLSGVQAKERTVRTALHRLKNAQKIRNKDERWFPAGMVPEVEDVM